MSAEKTAEAELAENEALRVEIEELRSLLEAQGMELLGLRGEVEVLREDARRRAG